MLIVAQCGQSSESRYYSVKKLAKAVKSAVDIVLIPVRLTQDDALVIASTPSLHRQTIIRKATIKELRRRTAGSRQPIETFDDALKVLFGTVLMAIELHERGAVEPLFTALRAYTTSKKAWGNVIFCSSNPFLLAKIRRNAPHAYLALIHKRHSTLSFVAWQPVLTLSAIFIHRSSAHSLVIEAAHRLGLLVCAYTVNHPKTALRLERVGVDAIITEVPQNVHS